MDRGVCLNGSPLIRTQNAGTPSHRQDAAYIGSSAFMLLDNLLHIETPEGSDLALHPAGIGVRIYAYAIDLLIKTVAIIVISMVLGFAGGLGGGLSLILFFLLQWFYTVYFEVWRDGRTPGKKRAGLRVVNGDGTPVTFATSLIRNLLRVVDFLPVFYVAGVLCMALDRNFRRLGDLAAGTLVVYVQEAVEPPQMPDIGFLPLPIGLSAEDQRALLAFAERKDDLSPERQAELAAILQPILPPGNPVATIQKMANGIVGRF